MSDLHFMNMEAVADCTADLQSCRVMGGQEGPGRTRGEENVSFLSLSNIS